MKNFGKVSIVIVTYNALDYILKCINSIRKYSRKYDFEIIVIDNYSQSETRDYLNNIYKKGEITQYIENSENLLLTRAQNQGLKLAIGDYIVFLNPDTEIKNDKWLEELILPLISSNDNAAISGPVYNFVPYGPMFGNIDMCCFCVTRELINAIGYLDERYPWNGAGFMYTCEAWARGFRYKYIKTNSIIHYGKRSRGVNKITNVHYNLKKEMKERNIKSRFSLLRYIKYRFFSFLN